MNEAFLTEKSRRVRRVLYRLNDFLVFVVGTLEFTAKHYKENLEFHEQFDRMADEELDALPDAERTMWISLKDRFREHDAECPFKSTKFRSDLGVAVERVHKQVERLRDTLAGTLSR